VSDTIFVWLAETADGPPRYATRPASGRPVELTADPHEARRFRSREACESWISGSSYARAFLPPLVAREHGFG
jgi:hypothetical protein